MKRMLLITCVLLTGCIKDNYDYDASGTFEAVETIVSAEATGVLKSFNAEEGAELQKGQVVGYIDSTQLYLKKRQLEAQVNAVLSRRPDVAAQIASLKEQLRHAEREQQRVANLAKSDAATQKQLDDANAQVLIIKRQLEAQESSLFVTTKSINQESAPLSIQIAQLEDQLLRCKIRNPVTGTLLTRFAEENEMAVAGKALYKIADLSQLTLRAYITGDQLPQVKLNQPVTVFVDATDGQQKQYKGTVQWVSDKAEFTPRTIQTRDERANLVYAIKIRVKNDGYLKIGMYGEVKFDSSDKE